MIILIDGHNLAYRMYYQPGLKRLKRADGKTSGVFFGFLSNIQKIITKFRPERLFIVFDGRNSSLHKSKTLKGYKAGRKKAKKSLYRQINDLQKLFTNLGIRVLVKEKTEADDILWHIAKFNPFKSIIISADRDMLQCITDLVKVYDDKEKKMWDAKAVRKKYGVIPKQIGLFKALSGDKSDNVKGVFGIGRITAARIIRKRQTIKRISGKLNRRQRAAFLEALKIVQLERNQNLEYFLARELKKPLHINKLEVKKLLKLYSCYSILKKFPEWLKQFKKVR